jgi:hypothetical protein
MAGIARCDHAQARELIDELNSRPSLGGAQQVLCSCGRWFDQDGRQVRPPAWQRQIEQARRRHARSTMVDRVRRLVVGGRV